ncbi:hypothetical protein LWI29_005447 [Acer saccharum]|uniref:Integrase catalytic domain-containing protein n=1 Tax=Acer saccharum TaxID=4024 RepID=A0AA39VGW8_ACESA|nr:hypothetical protein LWI29_005447 [Acer saccharum]
MASPKTLKDVQRLMGCLASLNRFITKSTDKCAPFFRAIKKGKGLEWSKECETAFQKLKEYLGRAPILSKLVVGETLYLYLSVTEVATSSVLIRLEEGVQRPVYYISKALLSVETRLTKWAVELNEFDIRYAPKAAIKGQAVSDFIAEFTEPDAEVRRMMEDEQASGFQWKLHVNRSSNTHGSGAGIVITTSEGDAVECAMRFDFKATNNQVLDEYQAREEHMIAYLDIAKRLLRKFKMYKIFQIPREENEKADALSKLASATISIRSKAIPMAHLTKPSTAESEDVMIAEIRPSPGDWTTQLKKYLEENVLPEDAVEAKRIKYRSTQYTILRGELYRRGFSKVLQRCVACEETRKILKDVHSGVYGNHTGGKSLAHKVLRQGFYWPTLFVEAQRFAESCETCQRIVNDIRQPPELLKSLTSPWPFTMWGLDLIGPMPTRTKGGAKHATVAVDYFTKWVEAEALMHITEANTTSFIKKNIIYRFGIPSIIITDNRTQFDNSKFREMCEEYKIVNYYASLAHPQTNGQTEAVNKVIKHTLKAKLEARKGYWADKLPEQNLDELEEVRDAAQVRNAAYQQRATRYYNSHVRVRKFQLGVLVLRRVSPYTKDKLAGSLADKWEGSYIIKGVAGHGAYMITRPEGILVPRPCNA